MRPSEALKLHREEIRALVARHRVVNPRVFGSVLTGTVTETSDLDLLVDPLPETTLFDLGGLQAELEDFLQVEIDLATPNGLHSMIRGKVLAKAEPL